MQEPKYELTGCPEFNALNSREEQLLCLIGILNKTEYTWLDHKEIKFPANLTGWDQAHVNILNGLRISGQLKQALEEAQAHTAFPKRKTSQKKGSTRIEKMVAALEDEQSPLSQALLKKAAIQQVDAVAPQPAAAEQANPINYKVFAELDEDAQNKHLAGILNKYAPNDEDITTEDAAKWDDNDLGFIWGLKATLGGAANLKTRLNHDGVKALLRKNPDDETVVAVGILQLIHNLTNTRGLYYAALNERSIAQPRAAEANREADDAGLASDGALDSAEHSFSSDTDNGEEIGSDAEPADDAGDAQSHALPVSRRQDDEDERGLLVPVQTRSPAAPTTSNAKKAGDSEALLLAFPRPPQPAAVPASTTRANEEIKYISYDNFCSLEPAKQKQILAAISDRCFNKPVTEWHEKDVDVIGGLREDNPYPSVQVQTLLTDPELGENAAILRDRLTSSKTSEPLTLRYRATILASYLNITAPKASVSNDNNTSSSGASRELALLKEKVIKIFNNLPTDSAHQEILGSTEFNDRFKGDSTAISSCIDSLLHEVLTIRQLMAIFDKNYIVWNDKRKDGQASWEFIPISKWEPNHVALLSQLLDRQDNLRELLEAAKQAKYQEGTFPQAVAVLINSLLATPLSALSQAIKEQAAKLQKQPQQRSATDDEGLVPVGMRAESEALRKTTPGDANARKTFGAVGNSATSSAPYSPSRPPNDGWGGTVTVTTARSRHPDGSAGGVNYAAFHGLNESQKNRVLANILNKYTDESAFAPATEWHPNDIDVFFGFMRALNGPTNLNRRLLDNLEIRGLYRKRDGYTALEILTLIAKLTQQVDDTLFVALRGRYNFHRLVAILRLNETTDDWYDDDVKFIEELRQDGALDVILGSLALQKQLSANETREIPAEVAQLIGDLRDTTSVLSRDLARRYQALLAQTDDGVAVDRPSSPDREIDDDGDYATTDNCLTKGAKVVGSTLKSGCTKFLMWNHSGKAAIAFGVPAFAAGYAGALMQFAAPWVAANAAWLTTAGTTLSKVLPEAVAAFGLAHAVPPAILAFYALGAVLAVVAAVFLIAFIYKKCTEPKPIVYTAVKDAEPEFNF